LRRRGSIAILTITTRFGTFARCQELLRQTPVQAADRADLRAQLQVASGGVVFTTIQKFLPEEKGDRRQIAWRHLIHSGDTSVAVEFTPLIPILTDTSAPQATFCSIRAA
jgi:type I site-specific restriction-modification system R (restriction) subunit